MIYHSRFSPTENSVMFQEGWFKLVVTLTPPNSHIRRDFVIAECLTVNPLENNRQTA